MTSPTGTDLSLQGYTLLPAPPDYSARLRKEEFVMLPIERADALRLVKTWHYARGGSNTGGPFHGIFHRDNLADCLGCAWWLPPLPTSARFVLPLDEDAPALVLNLHRFCIAEGVPKNAASFLLARAVKAIKRAGRYRALITYADEGMGHKGTIYRASNWDYLGTTTARHPRWVDEEGVQVSVKAGPKTRTSAEMVALGYTREDPSAKHRFAIRF